MREQEAYKNTIGYRLTTFSGMNSDLKNPDKKGNLVSNSIKKVHVVDKASLSKITNHNSTSKA